MTKVIVFAGTSEGRTICEFLAENKIEVTACVATEYGTLAMTKMENITIKERRLSTDEITEVIQDFDLVIDATHPYAEVISNNIRLAIDSTGKEYLRIIRPYINYENVIKVSNIEEACDYLNQKDGSALVTTGSKVLAPYTKVEGYEERLYFRFLPTIEALNECKALGIKPSNIICMQGPFSKNINIAMLEQIKGKYLITKESGRSGGFIDKLEAAKQLGVEVILIGKSIEEEGLELERAFDYLKEKFSVEEKSCSTKEESYYIEEKSYSHFPLFVDISDKKVVVIGGGNIATRRVNVLKKFGAKVTVIAPENSNNLEELCKLGKINIIKKIYEKSDILDAYMVIAATNSREVNEIIKKDAKLSNILTNIADKKKESDFYFPAIFSDEHIIGGLISNNGSDHHMVKQKAANIRAFLNNGGAKNEDN